MTTFLSAAWDRVTNTSTFGSALATDPATLPSTAVSTTGPEAVNTYVRFVSTSGTVVTVNANQYFAVNQFSFNPTQVLNIGSQTSGAGAGKVSLNTLNLSLGDASLNPTLFKQLAVGTLFSEVDLLSYSQADGKLISEDNFGLVGGTALSIDSTGVVQYSAEFGALELQHNYRNPNGSLTAAPTAAWNAVTNISGFSTNGTASATPLAAPTLVPTTTISNAQPATVDTYVRFMAYSGAYLTLAGNTLFAVNQFDFGATQTLNLTTTIGAGKVSFSTLDLSLGNASLNPTLFKDLASGTPFQEVDLLSYNHATGALVSANSFGLVAGSSLAIDSAGIAQYSVQYGALNISQAIPCFLRGTRISTPSGECAVEALRPGDLVQTWSGQHRPIRWIGLGRTLVTPGNRCDVSPVIILQGALADNIPARDLHVTRHHAMLVDDVLIPAEHLINGSSVLWDETGKVIEYYHIELDSHDILIAEGAPSESFRDDGNATQFQNLATRPARDWEPPCRPVVEAGEKLEQVWRQIAARAGRLPATTFTADPDLHLLINGVRINGTSRDGACWVFPLPPHADHIEIASNTSIPATDDLSQDLRRLGVAVRQISVWRYNIGRVVPLNATMLVDGWHEPGDGHRWTKGRAVLPADALRLNGGAMLLELEIIPKLTYRRLTPPAKAQPNVPSKSSTWAGVSNRGAAPRSIRNNFAASSNSSAA